MNLIGLLWEELERMVNKSISEIEKVKAVHFMLENIGYLIKDNLHVKIKPFFFNPLTIFCIHFETYLINGRMSFPDIVTFSGRPQTFKQ